MDKNWPIGDVNLAAIDQPIISISLAVVRAPYWCCQLTKPALCKQTNISLGHYPSTAKCRYRTLLTWISQKSDLHIAASIRLSDCQACHALPSSHGGEVASLFQIHYMYGAHVKVNITDLLLIGAIMLDVRHCYGRMQANVGGVAEAEWESVWREYLSGGNVVKFLQHQNSRTPPRAVWNSPVCSLFNDNLFL